jgi:elongation factor 1 alpha-like protein
VLERLQRWLFRYAVTLLDAPGHQDFVPNLITGVAQADAALLVVDGAPGGFEAGFGAKQQPSSSGGAPAQHIGQTREHVHVARSAGIKQMVVVVTKLDVCGYKQERFEEIKGCLGPFLKSCGYPQPEWLPVSAPDGQNVSSPPSDARLQSWWHDAKTLVDAIDCFQPVTQHLSAAPILLTVIITTVCRHKAGVLCWILEWQKCLASNVVVCGSHIQP